MTNLTPFLYILVQTHLWAVSLKTLIFLPPISNIALYISLSLKSFSFSLVIILDVSIVYSKAFCFLARPTNSYMAFVFIMTHHSLLIDLLNKIILFNYVTNILMLGFSPEKSQTISKRFLPTNRAKLVKTCQIQCCVSDKQKLSSSFMYDYKFFESQSLIISICLQLTFSNKQINCWASNQNCK